MKHSRRRGDDRTLAWKEDILLGLHALDPNISVEYAYWRGGAELRAVRTGDGRVLATEPTIPHYWLRSEHLSVQVQAVKFLKRVTEAEKKAAVQSSDEHVAWRQAYPALAEYMECDSWPDGSQRRTSTLLVFCEAGAVKGCLNDRDAGRSLWATAGSLDSLLVALEAMLSTGQGEWRQSHYQPPTQKGPKGRRPS